jgi:hypothetical protein
MRKQHLIKHAPSRSMSLRQEVRLLSKQLRKLENTEPTSENINLMLRLTQRMDAIRKQLKPPVKKPVGRPKTVKPVEPEVVVNETSMEAILEAEKQRRETPEPSIVFEHARRAEVKAEIRKEREAIEILPIAAPQSDVQEVGEGITPPKQSGFTVASPGLIDLFQIVSRPLDSNEVIGSVGLTNALHRVYDHEPEPHEPVGEGGYLSDGMGHVKRG